MPKQPDLIARAAQADPQISATVKKTAKNDYAESRSKDPQVQEKALKQLRELSALTDQNGLQVVVGSAPKRAKRYRFSRSTR